jgi:prevent-host-death family protein
MARTVNIHEAKTHLSRLVRRAQAGEEIIIARGGTPVARLIAMEASTARVLGRDRGRFSVPADFNEPLEASTLAEFEE